jgi:hypothetical protein
VLGSGGLLISRRASCVVNFNVLSSSIILLKAVLHQ